MTKRWWFRISAILAVFLIVVPFLAPAWSPINCQHQEIDLDTGRALYTHMLYWVPITTEIKDTPISKALGISDLESRQGDWHRVNTFSRGVRTSPHYIYHSALSQAQTLGTMWKVQQYSPEAQRETAANILSLWKRSGRDSGANDYLSRLLALPHEEVSLADVVQLENGNGEQNAAGQSATRSESK